MISFSFFLLPFIIVISSALDLETPNEMSMMPSGDFIDLMSRDAENVPGPIAFGAKYMTGGAGEGEQQLKNGEGFKERQDVKSDNVLPAYCEPPNPCPVGFTSSDGCLEEFDNSAEFSREYQAQQQCLCDQEHMFNCATKSADEAQEALQDILDNSGLHKTMMAKKYHESINEEPRRRKRSVPAHKINPYLQPNEMSMMPSGDFIDLMSRDAENVLGPIAFGAKYMTGGAGEGEQKLKNGEGFKARQDVGFDFEKNKDCFAIRLHNIP